MMVVTFDKKRMTERLCELLLIVTVLFSTLLGAFLDGYIEYVAFASAEPKLQTVIIDAGHGGEDSGAVGVNGALEKDLNLEIALQVGEELTSRGYEVIYTRTEDKLLYKPEENIKGIRKISDLKNRCAIANSLENAIFVSIHMNSFGSSKYSGLQVYYSPNSEGSYRIAERIQSRVREDLQPDNHRVIKEGRDIYILENIKHPAVLVECGFLTNPSECDNLCKKEYQKRLSFSIVCGIINT
jgi:N-acetylmuramoyl-L-alanine amidase